MMKVTLLSNNIITTIMEQERKSRWEGNEHWFKFGHEAGLQRFENIKSLGETPTAVALRSLKYQLEDNL